MQIAHYEGSFDFSDWDKWNFSDTLAGFHFHDSMSLKVEREGSIMRVYFDAAGMMAAHPANKLGRLMKIEPVLLLFRGVQAETFHEHETGELFDSANIETARLYSLCEEPTGRLNIDLTGYWIGAPYFDGEEPEGFDSCMDLLWRFWFKDVSVVWREQS